ncbi:MAG: hypothetical protein KKF44_07610, partial [Nanoarchaeota archaeon]|nr:hypothetical protein [Nanoarchaeota archaeon]
MNITYREPTSANCTAYDNKTLKIKNYDADYSLIDSTEVKIYDSSDVLIDSITSSDVGSDTYSYSKYIPIGKRDVEVMVPLGSENLSYRIYNLNFSDSIIIESQMIENYSSTLPELITSATPLIAVNDTFIEFDKAQLWIPKRNLEINTIMHCTDFNYTGGECNSFDLFETDDFEFNETEEYIVLNVTSFDAFGGGAGSTLPNLTQVRIYNVTGLSDTHAGGTLVSSGLNISAIFTADNLYRIEFNITNQGRRWTLDAADVIYHDLLNETWAVNATRDIWYKLDSNAANRTGGTFAGGKVSWNPGLAGYLNAGQTGLFSYVVNITTTIAENYSVFFLLTDTSFNSGSVDYSKFIISDNTVPQLILNYPGADSNVSMTSLNFNWTVFDDSDSILLCNLTIDGALNTTIISSENGVSANLTITGIAYGNHNWSVACADDWNNVNTSDTYSFNVDNIGPVVNIIVPSDFSNITAYAFNLNATSSDAYSDTGTVIFMYRIDDASSWNPACSDDTIPYSCQWNLTGHSDGTQYKILAYGNDSLGNFGMNDSVNNITVDISGPLTNISAPSNFTNISAMTYDMNATAIDAISDVDSVSFMFRENGSAVWQDICSTDMEPYSCPWNLIGLPDANSYEVLAYSNDTNDFISLNSTAFNITIDHTGPSVIIAHPFNFSNISVDHHSLNATADDALVDVDAVTFMYQLADSPGWNFACSDNSDTQ